ncbi:MAG: hypothetical protein WCT14_09940 [Treponemataceae bacterium]
MTVPDSASAPMLGFSAIGISGDNERAERVPDNEAVEMKTKMKAPLPEYQGSVVDAEA